MTSQALNNLPHKKKYRSANSKHFSTYYEAPDDDVPMKCTNSGLAARDLVA